MMIKAMRNINMIRRKKSAYDKQVAKILKEYDRLIAESETLMSFDNKEIINKPKTGISIGEHVWIGMKSTILKDVKIADNVVIGACSLVNKSIAENYVAVAGVPAKIIKRNVDWDRRNTDRYAS